MIISGKTRSVVVLRASGRDEEEIGGDYMRSRCKLLLHSQLTSSDRGSHYHKPTHTYPCVWTDTHTLPPPPPLPRCLRSLACSALASGLVLWPADIISRGLWERKREFWEWSDHRKAGMSEAKRQADRERDSTIKVKEAQRRDDDASKQRDGADN